MSAEEDIDRRPFVIDHITLICKGCQSERRFPLAKPLRSAEALIEWMKTEPAQCPCGAPTCDVKARFADQN